jgi:hypothetical protein
MTANRNFKRRVRARATKTGQSYTTALRHLRQTPGEDVTAETKRLRLAVAQAVLREDPRHTKGLRDSGSDIRRLMREAHDAGAALVHFPKGATCSPHKRIMSAEGPDKVGPADWTRFEWGVLRQELAAIAELARKLRLWTVVGSVHCLTPPNRPHNSLYVISDRGQVVTRYDEQVVMIRSTLRQQPAMVPRSDRREQVARTCSSRSAAPTATKARGSQQSCTESALPPPRAFRRSC